MVLVNRNPPQPLPPRIEISTLPATPAEPTLPTTPPAPEPTANPAPVDLEKREASRARTRGVDAHLARSINEKAERELVGGRNRPGVLVDLGGSPENGLALTVHGINDAPQSVDPLSKRSLATGAQTRTFAWDDNYRRLGDSTRDLSAAMEGWLRDNPGKPLTIHAHSMGTRISLAALDDLNQKGLLRDRTVELNLVAPALGGFDVANNARSAPRFLDGMIKNLRPSRDMGNTSDFQKHLESIRLPDNVHVRVFLGGKDTIIDGQDPHLRSIIDNLHGRVIDLETADHSGAVDAAARWLGEY